MVAALVADQKSAGQGGRPSAIRVFVAAADPLQSRRIGAEPLLADERPKQKPLGRGRVREKPDADPRRPTLVSLGHRRAEGLDPGVRSRAI